MRRVAFAFACAFAMAAVPDAGWTAQDGGPVVRQKESIEDLKSLPAPGSELKNLPPGNTESSVGAKAVSRRDCIPFPGARRTYVISIPPRRTTFFAVTPNSFFDVVMTVRAPGFFDVIDNFFAGGTERLRLFNRSFVRLNAVVTISGFRRSTGCFFLSARP